VRDWILILSASAALLAIACSTWLGVRAYRRKLQAEERLARAACAETDVRLVHAFADLVLLAAGTGRYTRSGELLRALLKAGVIGEEEFSDAGKLQAKVVRLTLVPATACGPTASLAAVYGIAALAERHEVLREMGARALELERVREIAPEQVRELLKRLRGQDPKGAGPNR
jgi:hypothetical protein